MEGPKSNGGRNDDHADHGDNTNAINWWNELPRREQKKEKNSRDYCVWSWIDNVWISNCNQERVFRPSEGAMCSCGARIFIEDTREQ